MMRRCASWFSMHGGWSYRSGSRSSTWVEWCRTEMRRRVHAHRWPLRHAGRMEVRRLTTGDEQIAQHICKLFDEHGDRVIDAVPFLQRPEAVMFVAEDESGPCGCVYGHELVHPDGERTMLLYSLDVAEPVRRRGYGTALVTAFVDYADEIGCTEV